MRFKVENINDISDSRQLLESKPNKLIFIFIYIFISMILSGLIWCWFSEKEIVVKVQGIVKTNDQVTSISSLVSGKIQSVHVKNGQSVKIGDILYTIEDSDLKKQKDLLQTQKNNLETDNKNLTKLKNSINNNTNYFSQSKDEIEYYYKFKSYENDNAESLSDKNVLITSKSQSLNDINKLQNLIKSIDENKNYNEKDSVYENQYNNYLTSKKNIENNINQLNSVKLNLQTQKESIISKIDELNNLMENTDIDSKMYQEKIDNLKLQLSSLDQQLNDVFSKLESTQTSLDKLKSDAKIQIKNSIYNLENQIINTNNNISSFDEKLSISKNKRKLTLLTQIEEKTNLNNQKLKEINSNLNDINDKINNCTIKATINGQLDIKSKVTPGMIIQSGTNLADILPNNNYYKVELSIPDKSIGTLKVSQKVKYSFSSLPYQEYGFINGELISISSNSHIDSNTGHIYFLGEGSLESNILHSHKNETVTIKPGMSCEARIVSKKEKMLYYLLEKINLLD